MTTPLIAWAAVAPDGMVRAETVKPTQEDVWAHIEWFHMSPKRARIAGWRVVQVEIRLMEDGK